MGVWGGGAVCNAEALIRKAKTVRMLLTRRWWIMEKTRTYNLITAHTSINLSQYYAAFVYVCYHILVCDVSICLGSTDRQVSIEYNVSQGIYQRLIVDDQKNLW